MFKNKPKDLPEEMHRRIPGTPVSTLRRNKKQQRFLNNYKFYSKTKSSEINKLRYVKFII